ncbi:MAG: WS/DGAT/MGAT family O-acyltransferase [Solirubrobacterales bacterium]
MGDRLSALDMTFLQIEEQDSGSHMHVGSAMLFDGQLDRDDLMRSLEASLHQVPRYRQRLQFPPAGVARPEWVDDASFDLGHHVREHDLDGGDLDDLREFAGRLFSRRLDRDKPLWEQTVVRNVSDGRSALVSKTHHCMIDGLAGMDVLSMLFDTDPDATPPEDPSAGEWDPDGPPSKLGRLGGVAADTAGEIVSVPGKAVGAAVGAATDPIGTVKGAVDAAQGAVGILRERAAASPDSPYNGQVGSHRRFAWVDISLEDVKKAKEALGVSVNDVVLAAMTGALRRDLARRGASTDEPLTAQVPVSIRTEEQEGQSGNRVVNIYCPLPVDEPEPHARVRRVAEAMDTLKDGSHAVGAEALLGLGTFAPPNLMAQASRELMGKEMFNLTISNVPGPRMPLYLAGQRMTGIYPQMQLFPGHGLGVAVISYDGQMCFGFSSDPDMVGDPACFADDLTAAFAELN